MPLPPRPPQSPPAAGPGQGQRNPNQLPIDRRASAPGRIPDNPADDDLPPPPKNSAFTNQAGGRGTLSEGVDVGEYLTVDDDPDAPLIEDADDGGVFVTIGQPYERPETDQQADFYANLADDIIPDSIQSSLVSDIMRKVEMDKEARKKRDEQYEDGLRRTGLGKDAPGGAQFEGASKVVHPMMTEACIDYESRIIKELWPISGPVKPKIVGAVTPDKTERADRKVAHMNYQLTEQIKEARAVMETTFTQVPLGGVQYVRQWWDARLERPKWEFVSVDNVYLPFSAADFWSSHRWTYAETISGVEYKQRCDHGVYRDLDLPAPSQIPDRSKTKAAADKIEGVEDPGLNIDGEREIWNVMAFVEITEEMEDVFAEADDMAPEQAGRLYPYYMSIDVSSQKLLTISRNWEREDQTHSPIDHLFEFPFIPWRGALSIGFPQIIGGLSGAATGALRALLDSAHANNAITAFVLKGTGLSGTSSAPQIGEIVEIDGAMETDDIRKRVMAPPFNPPSPVLFQLLGFLVEAAKGTVRTSMDEATIDANSNVPVGTQLSRVEEGLVVFSAVHARAHAAFNRLLMGLHRLNKMYLPDELRVDREGTELLVRRDDYMGPCDVQPVSDPTVYSDQQRFAQITAMEQAAVMFPNLYDMREIQKRKLKLWKVSDVDSVLKPEPKAEELNAVNENLSMALGRPTVAFPEQDHLQHLRAHTAFLASPLFGGNPMIAMTLVPLALKHCLEHMALFYVTAAIATVKKASGGMDAVQMMSKDPQVKAQLDALLAEATIAALPEIEAAMTPMMPIIQKAQQMLQAMQPKPPMDPATAAVQAAGAETARKSAADQATQQIDAAKNQGDQTLQQQELALKYQQMQSEANQSAQDNQTKIATTNIDSDTATSIAEMRMTSGAPQGFSDGESISHGNAA